MRFIFLLQLIVIAPFTGISQYDHQISIKTDSGIFSISKTMDGHDQINFPLIVWDQIAGNSKYNSIDLPAKKSICVFIQISDKYASGCRSGIGFSCGIWDRKILLDSTSRLVNNCNRVCAAIIERNTGSMVVTFIDIIDWNSLQ